MKFLFLFYLFQFNGIKHNGFIVRDSQTGAPLDAEILIHSINPSVLSPEQWHQIKLGQGISDLVHVAKEQILLPQDFFFLILPDKHLQIMQISADGYIPIQTYIAANSTTPITQIMLDQSRPDLKAPDVCDHAQICGYVYDQTTAQALANVRITISGQQYDEEVFSNPNGAFSTNAQLPNTVALTFEHDGFQSQNRTNIDTQSPMTMVVDLKKGQGFEQLDMQHPLSGIPEKLVDHDWVNAKLQHEATQNMSTSSRERPTGAIFLEPPASIRVGFDGAGGYCCGNNCATSQVYSLETYVQRGLDNEWISFWDEDSLKAGSIPFRSYGAWHVINEVYDGYDICAGPCCQAFEFTGFTATMDASIATNGIMLDQEGSIARSEYSAQNNSWDDPNDGLNCTNTDLSCGDGAVGSPATGWSCLADPLATGLGCFGHGRGMSQWGTQFRAQDGETFADIVDHYYNANNNPAGQRSQYASTPVSLNSIAVNQPVIAALGNLTIDYEVFNASDASHPFGSVLLGASLFDGVNYFSDPTNDQSVQVNLSGSSVWQRPFQLNQSITPEVYDLITALYLDVDNNGQISSTDWLLQVQTVTDALTVLSENDLIFKDGFNL